MSYRKCLFSRCAIAVLVVAAMPAPDFAPVARADEFTATYFEQLRIRHLFGIAEAYCLDHLERADLPPALRADLTVELSRTFVEHARNSQGNEQADLWKRAAAVIDDQLAKAPADLNRVPLELQRALVPAARGDYLIWQVEFSPQKATLRKEAQGSLEEANSRLSRLDESLAKRVEQSESPLRRRSEPVSRAELQSLLAEVRLQLGIASLNRARLLPAGSAERSAGLVAAQKWLTLVLKSSGRLLRWNDRLALAQLHRLRGEFLEALKQLDAITADNPTPEIFDRVVAEQVLLRLAEKNPADAAEILVVYRKSRERLPGELCLLKVQTTLALMEVARQKQQAELVDQLYKQAETHVEWAEREVGGYWAFRCRQLLQLAREGQTYGPELAQLMRAAKTLYAEGDTAKAIEAYGQAAAAAKTSGNDELAMELGFTQASIQLQAGQSAEAADSFHQLALGYPKSPRAAAAHLMWAYGLGRLFVDDRSESRQTAYAKALTEHLDKFPADPTAVDATWMFARLEDDAGYASRALKMYLRIPADHSRGPETQVAVARCYETLLNDLRRLKQPVASMEDSALSQLEKYIAAFASPELTLPQAEVALRLARIRLDRSSPQHTEADALLERILKSHEKARQSNDKTDQAAWDRLATTAGQLRVLSLAGRGRFAEAEQFVASLGQSSPKDLLNILDGLSQLDVGADRSARRTLGSLQLKAAEGLAGRRTTLTADEQERLRRCLAQAHIAAGQPNRAIELYEAELLKAPRDKRLLQKVARFLTDCDDELCLNKAKALWKRLEALETKGESAWLDARYHVALCCFKLKQRDECAKLLKVTRLLYPDLGGAEQRARFAELESRVR